ncbi:MAG TPA: cytochrome P450 [Noviherbaspirillum sp.]|uniref:cytochrome P450 n=1 Tax=Noviherbaspirillum sp. TaxID=1926288 RepID=UPI002B495D6C|nr:cytochrome P450 [Noviherbaspirillum sp.]HJV86888.1 cytochrome P450 [Noviherbaspirillum sp.]
MNHQDSQYAAQAANLAKTYDPLDLEIKQDPYPYYAKLRRDEPVKWIEGLQAFAVARYDDVDTVLKDASIFSSAQFWPALLGEFDPVPEVPPMISMDPPNHMQLRKLVNRAFLPTQVNALTQRTVDIANQLIDDLAEKYGSEGECDWVWDFTSLYPVTVISEVLGVPSERRAEFKVWVDDVLAAANRAAYGPERLAEIRKSSDAVRAFFEELYDQRTANPGNDMISQLIQAEVDGVRLTRIEVIQMAILLLIGGVETTTNLLGNSLVELKRRPEVYARLRKEPALIPQFIDEVLRFNPVVQMIFRHTTCNTELAGVHMPKGSAIMVLLASANRDETKFSDSESFDMDRKSSVPLMSFGQGPHFCLGKYLSLMETRSALEIVFKRFETLEPVSDKVEWIDSYFARGPHHLRVRYKLS